MLRRRREAARDRTQTGIDLVALIDDDSAFRRWYDEAAPRVYAYLYSRTGSVHLSEELTQQTFIEVIRNPQTHDGRSELLPWAIGIARHRLSRHFRAARRDEERSRELVREIEVAADDKPWHRLEAHDQVLTAIDQLSSVQRGALMLRFVDDLTVRQVADVIGRSEDATESLIRRARQAFEEAYREIDAV